jgi:hypothetical protein
MIVVVIGNEEDYQLAVNKYGMIDVKYVSHARYISQLIGTDNIDDFYCSELYPPDICITRMQHGWYKDQNEVDMSFNDGISVGKTLSHKLGVDLPTITREYYSLKYWSIHADYVFVSEKENNLFKDLALLFSNIKLYDFGGYIDDSKKFNPTASPQYSKIWKRFPIKSTIARVLQRLFFGRLLGQRIFLADWTYEKIFAERKGSLMQNSKLIDCGFYLSYFDHKYSERAEIIFSSDCIGIIHHDKNHMNYLLNMTKLDDVFIDILFDHIIKVYLDNRRIFISIYTKFYEAYNYYEPTNITFPGVSQPIYLIAIQLAFYLGIETEVMYDGYIMSQQLPRLTTDEGTPMVTKYIPFGQAGYDCFRAGGILESHISDPIFAPLLTLYEKDCVNLGVEVMVLSYCADDEYLSGRRDYRFQIMIDVVSLLLKMNYNKITIKIKSEEERDLTEKILKINGLIRKVKVISGRFKDIICDAKMVIGPLSSAMVETLYCGVPYYLYEPIQNGATQTYTTCNPAVISASIAYNIEELSENIQVNRSPFREESYYFKKQEV